VLRDTYRDVIADELQNLCCGRQSSTPQGRSQPYLPSHPARSL
jgi:hypothetical protein